MSYFAGKQKSELGDGRWLGQIQQGGFVFGIKSDQAGHGGAWSIIRSGLTRWIFTLVNTVFMGSVRYNLTGPFFFYIQQCHHRR